MQRLRATRSKFIWLVAVALLGLGAPVLAAEDSATATSQDEQTIRRLIQQENEGKQVVKYTDDAIYVSGAFPRPAVGAKQIETMSRDVMSRRSNVSRTAEMVRLVISKSRDLGYEFGNFKMSFDDSEGKKVSFTGNYLRVWRKVADEWKVDAFFARPTQEAQ